MIIEYIKSVIIEAFKEVKLEDGIGLWEAQAIDDYESKENQLLARDRDIKDDWQKISGDDIFTCYSSLSYFDKKGMLFHLPAFIIAELNNEEGISTIFHLSQSVVTNEQNFSLLNSVQKHAVATFLEWCALQEEYEFDRPHIQRALSDYWYKN